MDINVIVNDTQKMLHRLISEDIELVTEFNPEFGKIRVDQGQLEQAIINMAVNARDAMPNGGRLTIGTDNVQIDGVAAHDFEFTVLEGQYVRLTISDEGNGISADALAARIRAPLYH